LLFEHTIELARHPGGEEEAGLADVEGKAAGGADRVVEDFGGRRQHRLFPVVRRHDGLRRRKKSSMRCSQSSLRTSSTPAARAAISCERSPTVGPSPPLTMTASARPADSKTPPSITRGPGTI
jgi:hypothetical protein